MYSFVLASVAIVAVRHINAQNLGDLPVCAVSCLHILSNDGSMLSLLVTDSKLLPQLPSSKPDAQSQTLRVSAEAVNS